MPTLCNHLLFPCPYFKSVILSFFNNNCSYFRLGKDSENNKTLSVCFIFKFILGDAVFLLLILSALIVRFLYAVS